jgi:hypothetical protein
MREIKEVLPFYLGCDLVHEFDKESVSIGKMIGITESEINPGETVVITSHSYSEWFVAQVKPVLRKLSDMTEEDFQDVAKYFFGTDKLVFANYDKHWYACDRELDPEFDGDIIEHINEACDDDPENTIMCDLRTWNITHGWITWDEVYHGFSVTEQAKIFQALLSKSFDLFGLIDSGLAINKTTL